MLGLTSEDKISVIKTYLESRQGSLIGVNELCRELGFATFRGKTISISLLRKIAVQFNIVYTPRQFTPKKSNIQYEHNCNNKICKCSICNLCKTIRAFFYYHHIRNVASKFIDQIGNLYLDFYESDDSSRRIVFYTFVRRKYEKFLNGANSAFTSEVSCA